MRTYLFAAALSFYSIESNAQSLSYQERISNPTYPSGMAMVSKPKAYLGKAIAFRSAQCADDPKGSIICTINFNNRVIRIESGGLGTSGGDKVAELLIGPCKGLMNITKTDCRFSVIIEPTSAVSEDTMLEFTGERFTKFYSPLIELKSLRGKKYSM